MPLDPTLPPPGEPDELAGILTRAVEAAAGGDQAEVERMVAAHPAQAEAIRQHLRRLDQLGLMAKGSDDASPDSIGPYRILGVLGQGGMGIVYLAEQREPVHRRVALKVIKLGTDRREVLARFQLERQALAMMNHDVIAKVFDVGATERGQPYFAMEYVQGLPITEHCDKHRLTIEDRLRLFQRVCAGVQHAHQKGVIHRDLKPSNVLVTLAQGEAIPKIIDFGIARATNSHSLSATVFTEQGMILGTPEYMSPEQAEMSAQDIDTRTDIYSLGVILYELLVGELPFASADLRAAGLLGIYRKIREAEPPKPSTRLRTMGPGTQRAAERRRTNATALGRALRGDLDWIVFRAMEKDRSRRYASASALAEDLVRHLAHEPVMAGPPSAAYRLRKLARRYRGGLAAAGLVLAALTGGLGLATRFWLEARVQASAADEARGREAAKVREFDQLAGVVLLEQAEQREATLYPAWPEHIADLRKWLTDDAARVLAMRPTIEQTLADLREGAVPPGERDRDPSSRIAAEARGFLFRALEDLPSKLTRFEATQHRSVVLRLQWAERIGALTLAHPKARVSWDEARAAIAKADGVVASELYRGRPIALRAQMGLVPIGMNPVTKLWEFYELRSAWDGEGDPAAIEIPRHVPTGERGGRVKVADSTGIVFVLLPGGSFTMGSQSTDATRPYFDPQRGADEDLEGVELPPFFLARHELTVGQWRRLTAGDQPSYHTAHDTNPVENVDWFDCDRWLTRHGMVLPTEAQWEYGCRGGTATPWWSGQEQESLYRAANLRDAVLHPEEHGDGFRLLAPVDVLRPNPFGLHHVHGNVWEWCGDSRGSGRTLRGGCYDSAASAVRSAATYFEEPTVRHGRLGLRAARVLHP